MRIISQARRFSTNPIIHPGLSGEIGTNINGPSLIRAPSWIDKPLGKYYLYFAHHNGLYIRLAYSQELGGPWHIYKPGTLQLDQTPCHEHIASPDVHIDDNSKTIYMYYHGCTNQGQRSFMSSSSDGLNFTSMGEPLGPFYFRVFTHDGWVYAIAKRADKPGGGVILRSRDGKSNFEQGPNIIRNQRHAALLKRDNWLHIFFSRGYDCPEHVLVTSMKLTGNWKSWRTRCTRSVLYPETEYEGYNLPTIASTFGSVSKPVRQLRDPAIFEENGEIFLLYSCSGESSISIAKLQMSDNSHGIIFRRLYNKYSQKVSSIFDRIK